MLSLLIISLCFSNTLANAILDLTCVTSADAGYTGNAFACENNQADIACLQAYPTPADYITSEGNTEDRPFQCYTNETAYVDTAAIIKPIKDMAIASCAKQCGYCCETPEFKCANARFPRLNCATITNKMCRDPSWREIIAEDCPSACGFCLLGGCIDAAPDCETQPSICVTRGLESFVASNCQRTCDQCAGATTAGSSIGGACASAVDANANCVSWVKNGFCNNSFYTAAQKKSYCAKSCNLC